MTTDWLLRKYPPGLRRKLVHHGRYARRLEEIDERAARLADRPMGRLLWSLYLFITIILCFPVYAIKITLYIALLAGWIFALTSQIPIFVFFIAILTIGLLTYRWFTRPVRDKEGIFLDRKDAVGLFSVLDDVAARLSVAPVSRIRLRLSPSVGIRQKMAWRPRPHTEVQLELGLIALYSLTFSQLKAVLAHEYGHVLHKDSRVLSYIGQALVSLQNWVLDTNVLGLSFLGIFLLPVSLLLEAYLKILVLVSCWAIRRQEYSADHVAVGLYGKTINKQALLSIMAVDVGFEEYCPVIRRKIESDFDRRDFYNQFVDYWDNLDEAARQEYYAKGLASLNSVYDTHPSFKARQRALELVDCPSVPEQDDRKAITLLANASELGRALTVQKLQRRRM